MGLLLSEKSGKTTFEALVVLTMTLLYGGAFPETYILANSLEQGRGRVFEICIRIVQASPLLRDEAQITAETIRFPAVQRHHQASSPAMLVVPRAPTPCVLALMSFGPTPANAAAGYGMK